jgi:hypothetical protein
MTEKTVLSKEELINNIENEFYLGFIDFEKKYLENIHKLKTQQEYFQYAGGIIESPNFPPLKDIMTKEKGAKRSLNEYFLLTFMLQYSAQMVRNIFSKHFDNFNNNLASPSERSNQSESRAWEEKLRDLEVKVTEKERIILEERANLEKNVNMIKNLEARIKNLEADLLNKDRTIPEQKEALLIKDKNIMDDCQKENADSNNDFNLVNNNSMKQRKKHHNKKRRNIQNKMETQNQNSQQTVEFPINVTQDMNYIDQHFTMTSCNMIFYDFPWFWKNEKIYEVLKTVGYVEHMKIKRSFKYKTFTTSICLTKDYERIFKNGGHNIYYTKDDHSYFFRMFDAAISMKDIKRLHTWQAVKDVTDEINLTEGELIKNYIKKYGGHFAKILKVIWKEIYLDLF